jgi:NADH-quinone oxidoreductase subunit F
VTDLHLGEARADAAERSAVDAVVAVSDSAVTFETERLVRGGAARRRSLRHLLLPALHALQAEVGWISPGGLNLVSERLGVPPAEAYGVATFYEMFRVTDPGHADDVTHVCIDGPCQIAGAAEHAERLRSGGARVHLSPCLGQCERAPAVFVQGRGRPDRVPADDAEAVPFRLPQHGDPGLRVLARVGVVDPTSLDSYRAHGGYRGLARAVEIGPDAVIDALSTSGLSGRGGAAFPAGAKWRAVADAPGDTKHVVANCDESEPGTFKDRTLLEHDPFTLVESMTICGLSVGAEHGWVYMRGEYPRATARVAAAVRAAHDAGLLGTDVAGTGRRFDIEIRRGAGAYICGEETALFNSIEGHRGEPRNKPPYPTTHGLFGEPTAINNVETFANVVDIVADGPDPYRARGTGKSPGTRLFCLSGRVAVPGVYEADFGVTLGELLDMAGGITGDLRAVLLGGAAGAFVGPDDLDLELSLDAARAAGLSLGSGVVVAFGNGDDMVAVVERVAEFFRDESCGQCVPCRVGTVRQHEIIVELNSSGSLAADRRRLLDDIGAVMADASICGLGHTAAGAVRSALDLGLIGDGP